MDILQQFLDRIIITTDAGSYNATPEEFAADGGTLPALPEGITGRVYRPGRSHALKQGDDVIDGGPMPWPEGDAVMSMNANLIQKKQAREDAKAQEEMEARRI